MQVERSGMSHKPNEQTPFEIDKAIAAIAYLVEHATTSMYTVLKMMYIADKMHLERYGRFISGDKYAAMEQGPVPSSTYNMIKHLRDESGYEEFERAKQYLGYGDEHQILVQVRPDYEELSASDVECLDEIVSIYCKVGKWAVRDMSHDAAWQGAWRSKAFFRNSVVMDVVDIARQFEDGDALVQHLADMHPGEAQQPAREWKRAVG